MECDHCRMRFIDHVFTCRLCKMTICIGCNQGVLSYNNWRIYTGLAMAPYVCSKCFFKDP